LSRRMLKIKSQGREFLISHAALHPVPTLQ
jgi:hypothetical protein